MRIALLFFAVVLGSVRSARAELTPDERTFSQTLDPAAREGYAATREFVRRAQAIVAKTVDPTTLGRKPKGYDAKYLHGDEAATVSQARDMSNIALMNGIKFTAPDTSHLGPPTPAQTALTADENAFAEGLGPAARKRYAATREFVHRSAVVANGSADPASLGRRPKDFDAAYLKDGEAATLTKARDLSNIALMKQISISK